ncbi:MAG: hemerythrin domain-containing protein [Aquihabitans sp.]
MDAITLLKNDHKNVEKLFQRFEKAGERAYVEKRKIVDQVIEELTVHASIEEQVFYPVTRATVPAVEDMALESLEEHHVVKLLLAELQVMDSEHERFVAKMTVLMENVRHHVKEEEDDYFAKVRDELGRDALNEIGDAMVEAREDAPTTPRPFAPDEGAAGQVAAKAGGVVDRVTGTVSGLAQGGVAAVQDVVDRVRGDDTRRAAPVGSSLARKTSDQVRHGVQERLDRTIALVQETKKAGEKATERAKETVTKTAQAAKTGVKRTATSATKGAKATKTTAKQAATTTTRTAKRTAKK